jgi:multidrug efflux pump subunit AcrA (membrane-fusion protein)
MNRNPSRGLAPLVLVALALVLVAGCGGAGPAAAPEVWTCPMHPDYVSDRPGSCPICHMDLVRREAPAPAPPPAAEVWTCPMHPEVVSDRPGSCPICKMDLVRAERPAAAADSGGAHAPVELTSTGRTLAGVETVAAELATWSVGIRTVGSVVPDERRSHRIEARFSGWIEKLPVDFTGRFVRRGETVAEVYSPELVAAQQELLVARDAALRFATSALPEVRRSGEELLVAARRRLSIFGLPEGFAERLAETGEVRRTVPVVSPASGFVVAKSVFAGQQVMPGQEMFRLVDLSRVWVEAALYEADAARIRPGDRARLALAYEPAATRDGEVSYVYPEVDPAARTLRVRFDVANPDLDWKPGMFVDVELSGPSRPAIVVPDSALLPTGERELVFVESGPGRFEPREVTVGERGAGRAEILRGLAAGERVAVAANFLLDSESRLRAAIADRAPAAAAAPAPTGHEGHR